MALTLAVLASFVFIDKATAAPVEGTYTFTQTDPNSGPDEYAHTHRFSSGRIKQGESLEFMGRIDHTNRGWCFSSDVYDIQQTELNFRTAYSPRGYPHDVVGAQVRIYVTFRNRAWVSRENDPRCVQHHELTGTITGSETRQFEPGCYVLETYWEYGPSPKPRGTNQQESGALPHFCVDAASQTPQPPPPPPSPLPPGLPSPAPPPGSPPPPSPPVPPSGGAAGANRLLVDSFSAPKNALAGRLFVARLLVKNADGSSLARATVSCKAKVKKRSVKVLSRGIRAGRAFCTWRVPAARRKAFTGTIRITAAGAKVTRTFRRVIR